MRHIWLSAVWWRSPVIRPVAWCWGERLAGQRGTKAKRVVVRRVAGEGETGDQVVDNKEFEANRGERARGYSAGQHLQQADWRNAMQDRAFTGHVPFHSNPFSLVCNSDLCPRLSLYMIIDNKITYLRSSSFWKYFMKTFNNVSIKPWHRFEAAIKVYRKFSGSARQHQHGPNSE